MHDDQANGPAAGGPATPRDLSLPHPLLSPWLTTQAYDRITAMYLDCWDEVEIAKEISRELKRNVTAETIAGIRVEAARAAESQPHDVRLRWIYRYKNLSVNSLVKEYMFLEGKTRFLTAKRELADEIDLLIKNTPPANLCIAVNDSLGRNNVGMDMLEQLQAYGRTGHKVEALLNPYMTETGLSLDNALSQVAALVSQHYHGEAGKDEHRTRAYVAGLLKRHDHLITEDDVEYFLEYKHIEDDEDSTSSAYADRLAGRVDVFFRPHSIMERVARNTGQHMTYAVLQQTVDAMRSGPIPRKDILLKIREYTMRHQQDLDTLKRLGQNKNTPESIQKIEQSALQTLQKLTDQHLTLVDCRAFFSDKEMAAAARDLVAPQHLQAMLDQINALSSVKEVTNSVNAITAKLKRLKFPLDRYMAARFRLPE